jgi:hypothetical protein
MYKYSRGKKRYLIGSAAVIAVFITAVFFLSGFSGQSPPPETIGGNFVITGADFESGTFSGTGVASTALGGEMALSVQPSQPQGGYLSEPREAAFDFNALGLHWKAALPEGSRVDAEVRFSKDGDAWGDWIKVNIDDPDLPDHIADTISAGETIGQLVFADKARFFQYRLDLKGNAAGQTPAVTRLTASYIDAKGYHESALSVAGISNNISAMINPAPAEAAPVAPTIISRAQWGANEADMQWDPEYVPVKKIIVHHTAGSNNYDPDPAATIRAIYQYHAVALGWGDIGYNYLIDAQGRIYEGRYGGNTVVGGHALHGWNYGSVGIAALGNYEEANITPEMYNAFVDLMAWESIINQVDPYGNAYMNGSNLPNYLGHRDVDATACPGQYLYPYLPSFRAAVYALNHGKITAFTIPGQTGATTIDESAHTIAVTVPYGTDVTTIAPSITIIGASVSPASGVAHDFTNPSTYTVTGEDTLTQDYTVTVTVTPPPKEITAFTIAGQTGVTTIDETAHTIALSMPFGTDARTLMPSITIDGVSVSPASGVAHDFTNPSIYTVAAADASTQDYTVTATVAGPTRNYFWTWYDNRSSINWVLMALPLENSAPMSYEYMVGNQIPQVYADSPPTGTVDSGGIATSRFFDSPGVGLLGGPVKAASTTGNKAIASQRSLWKGGNSLEEVLGTEESKLSDHYYWTWYDNKSPGMFDWVMVSNPGIATIYYRIKIGGVIPMASETVEGKASDSIAPGQSANARFNLKNGPVEVETFSDPGMTIPANSIASQRVLTNMGTASEAFNEVPGIPETELSSDYLWTWYDNVSPGAYDWVLIANPQPAGDSASYDVYYEITVGGSIPTQMIEGTPTGIIQPGKNVTPRIANVSNGPVEVKTWKSEIDPGTGMQKKLTLANAIASQRTIWGPSFEEVPGYPRTALASDYHWTWYDQLDAGTYDWIHIINTNSTPVYYEITVGGSAPTLVVEGTASGTIAAGELVHPRFLKRGGPVEVRAWTDSGKGTPADVMTSQRVLWHGYFNEVPGTVLQDISWQIPGIQLNRTSVYWASYADYTALELSIDFSIGVNGSTNAANVKIFETQNINGVLSINTPLALGGINSGQTVTGTVKYSVPADVSTFRTLLRISVQEPSGETYEYPWWSAGDIFVPSGP